MKLRVLAVLVPVVALCAVDVPLRRIVLYKHGVAYFERAGSVSAGEEAHLAFRTSEMNDVLKSFTVSDSSGNRLSGVHYDANEPIEQQLAKFPFHIGEREALAVFLDNIKGAEIALKRNEQAVTGTIMGARVVPAATPFEQLTLLLSSGEIDSFDLGTTTSLRLTDPALQDQLRRYLGALARSKAVDTRSFFLDFANKSAKDLTISYVAPAAIWKSSYRLVLSNNSSTLEGWAIVDNTTDEDWNHVNLSVVSGRPISFVSQLDTPHFGNRQKAELPEDRAAGPVVYGGALASVEGAIQAQANYAPGAGSGDGYGPGSGGGTGGGVYHVNKFVPAYAARAATIASQTSTVLGATGETIGELFEYDFATPVTIRKNESAMLPFLQSRIPARKLLIYSATGSEHPVNAVELTNETGKTLDGGPVTVYDAGAYAGEALFETIKGGDKRLLGYAVDYGSRISTTFNSGVQTLQRIHFADGNLELYYSNRQTTTYTIHNVDAKPKTLLIEESAEEGVNLISPKPTERSTQANRFEVHLAPNGTRELKVEHERSEFNLSAVSTATPDFLLELTNGEIGSSARQQLREIASLKQRIIDTQNEAAALKDRVQALSADQSRLRQNIDSLNRVKGEEQQVRVYSAALAANEVELGKLSAGTTDNSARKVSLEKSLGEVISRLQF